MKRRFYTEIELSLSSKVFLIFQQGVRRFDTPCWTKYSYSMRTFQFHVLAFFAISLLTGCAKNKDCLLLEEPDYSTFEGTWDVLESITTIRDDTLFSTETYEYQFVLENNGSGIRKWDAFTENIQLSINPVKNSISVISIIEANLSNTGKRQLRSDNYQIIEQEQEKMLLRDVDSFPLQGVQQTVTQELELTRAQ